MADLTDKLILKRKFPPLYKRLWIVLKAIIKFGFKSYNKK